MRAVFDTNAVIYDDSQAIAEAWRVEALRRSAEIDSGTAETISAEDVRREVHKLLARKVGLTPESKPTIASNVARILGA